MPPPPPASAIDRRMLRALFAAMCMAMLASAGAGAQPVPAERPVLEIRLLVKDAGRVSWSAQGDRLAYDKLGPYGRYHIYHAEPDLMIERCLTCEPLDLRKKNNLNPTWHPSGDFIVFQVQSEAKNLSLEPTELSTAHRGLYSDLWLIEKDGKNFWRLTQSREQGGAIIDPHFSHEGDELLWSQRVRSRVGRWGIWALSVAEFKSRRGVPHLGKPVTYEPGRQKLFLAGSTFTPDDRGALIAGNREPGQRENGMDIYRLDFESGDLERLTHTTRAWDEQARYSPRGDSIVWSSANEIDLRAASEQQLLPIDQLRDLWIMNTDGSDQRRLTYFNHKASREALGYAIVDDFAWNPRGDQIVAHVIYGSAGEVAQALYLIELDSSFQR